MNEFIEQFLLESRELVEQATADLLALEENSSDTERLDGAFRAFHTLKGSAGIVDFAAMAKATHVAEDVLAAVRAGKNRISRTLISDCLSCLDQVVQWLDAMQRDGAIPATAEADAVAIARRFSTNAAPDVTEVTREFGPSGKNYLADTALGLLKEQQQLLKITEPDGFQGRLLSVGRVISNVLRSAEREVEIAAVEQATGEAAAAASPRALTEILEKLLADGTPRQIVPHFDAAPDQSARVLRVDVERIDALVKLTGELTVAKNAIGHAAQMAHEGAELATLGFLLKDQHAVLSRLVEELQRSVLSIRVLPLRHVFNRFPRLVREIAEALGKPVRVIMEGEETEADKVVVESLFEPLLHIIRNALDHGIESPDERTVAGKSPSATIRLHAQRTGDAVLVEVEDDGRGIDIDKVRRLAATRGIATADVLAVMSDEEAAELVFVAGFSTSDKVTGLSGRGVGMDVVRNNVERLGGTARIASRSGRGTVVTLKLPFSVMMTRVMTVQAAGQTFGIPLDSIVETARVPRDRIDGIGAAQALVLRDRTIPLIDLGRSLGHDIAVKKPLEANIVVVSIGGVMGGIEVDGFGDRLDVMLKPIDGLLQGVSGVAGTSLLGDGSVLIVLDLPDLLQ